MSRPLKLCQSLVLGLGFGLLPRTAGYNMEEWRPVKARTKWEATVSSSHYCHGASCFGSKTHAAMQHWRFFESMWEF